MKTPPFCFLIAATLISSFANAADSKPFAQYVCEATKAGVVVEQTVVQFRIAEDRGDEELRAELHFIGKNTNFVNQLACSGLPPKDSKGRYVMDFTRFSASCGELFIELDDQDELRATFGSWTGGYRETSDVKKRSLGTCVKTAVEQI